MNQPTPKHTLKGQQYNIPYENLPPPTPRFPVPYTGNELLGPELASEIWITTAAEAEALKRWQNGQATPAYTKGTCTCTECKELARKQ